MAEARFRDTEVHFANGAVGANIGFETANPLNFYEAISAPERMAKIVIDGKLFLPPGSKGPLPAVIVVPGSLGVAVSHLTHAETLTGLGIAAFVIDPFGARGVSSTVANQVQYSFAASAYDVLAAVKALLARPEIDAARIGAQGHSRGGSAVLSAAMEKFAAPVLRRDARLCGVYAAYPWCGEQFLEPDIGRTKVRAIIGDRDGWCLPQQVQAYMHAIRLKGGAASFRLVDGAAHSFDRETAVELIADASVAPGAPTVYIADNGALIHPLSGSGDPALVERDLMLYAIAAGYGVRGAAIGSLDGQPKLFRDDMVTFWRDVLSP